MRTRRVHRRSALARALTLLAALFVLGAPSLAFAVGNVTVKSRTLEEKDGKWKMKFTMDYGSKPHLAHVPMIFEFKQTVYYERTLTDQSPKKPVLNRKPMRNQQAINEGMDVGFGDGSGAIYRKTKFNFSIRRDRGFEAGEYTLKIKRSSDGAMMGRPLKLILKGDNPIVDRRAMSFVPADKGSKKKPDDEGAPPPPTDDGSDSGMPAEEDDEDLSDVEAADMDDPSLYVDNPSGEVAPKQGGCGCRVAGERRTASAGWALLGLGLAAALGRGIRRRRRVS